MDVTALEVSKAVIWMVLWKHVPPKQTKVRVNVHILLTEHHLKVAHVKLIKRSIFSTKCRLCNSLIRDVAEAMSKIYMENREEAKYWHGQEEIWVWKQLSESFPTLSSRVSGGRQVPSQCEADNSTDGLWEFLFLLTKQRTWDWYIWFRICC